MVQISLFHLMPYAHLDAAPRTWPVPHRLLDPTQAHDDYGRYLDQMALADELGWDWVGCNEHHYTPYGLMSNPTLIGAALTQRTRRCRIAMLGSLIALNNPVRIAEEYAMLDVMSGGRLIAGLIRGIPNEYIAYGVDPSTSWERFEEAYDLVLRAWTEPEPFGWEGKHYQFRTVSIWPRPLQQPHPPIFMSGGSGESARFAARKRAMMGIVRFADLDEARGLFDAYRAAARESGWEPPATHQLVDLHTWVARSDAEARATLAPRRRILLPGARRPAPARPRAGAHWLALLPRHGYRHAPGRGAAGHPAVDSRRPVGAGHGALRRAGHGGPPDREHREGAGRGHPAGPVQDWPLTSRCRRREHAPLRPRGTAIRPRAVAPSGGQSLRGAVVDRRSHLPAARAVDGGLPGGRGGCCVAGQPAAVSAPGTRAC
jgi:alkanesulfonate monooxygenase SsuD/methylene tetrahydromethanopterin reductase-like flavin-dependent oxidoreductase (luciferase family)